MKQRGIHPSARSFGTFLAGAAKAAQAIQKVVESNEGKTAKTEVGRISGEAMGRVETVHKQWLAHVEKITQAAEEAEVAQAGKGGGKAAKSKPATAPLVLPGLDVEFESYGSSSAASEGSSDGRLDTLSDLSPHPTNQYLAFLSSILALSSPTTTPSSQQTLTHLLSVFSEMPLPSAPGAELNPLARNGVSYSLAFSALRSVLISLPADAPPSSPSSSTSPPADTAEVIESSTPLVLELLETGQNIYTQLLESPPPSSASQSSFSLTPTHPTSFLSLFLAPPRSSSTLPAPLWQSAVEAAQSAFGFVPPFRVADLTPPHPEGLEKPLAKLDGMAFGTALKILLASGKGAWARGWWEQSRDHGERFGLDTTTKGTGRGEWEKEVATRENGELVMKGCGGCGDVEGIEGAFFFSFPFLPSLSSLSFSSRRRIS